MRLLHRFLIIVLFLVLAISCRNDVAGDIQVSRDAAGRTKNPLSSADSLNNKAINAWHNGDYQTALQYIKLSVENARRKGDEKEMASALNNQGLVNWSLNNGDTALECYEEAGKISKKLNLFKLLGLTHTNRGLVYKSREEFDKALEQNNEAIRIFTEHGSYRELAIALNNQGQIYKKQRQYAVAKSYYLKALENYRKENYLDGMAATYCNVAEIHLRENNKIASLENIRKSIRINESVKNHVQINDSYKMLAEIYEHFNEKDSALKYYKVYNELNTKQLLANQSGKLASYQASLGTEVKNLRITNLQKERQLAQGRLWLVAILSVMALLIVLSAVYWYSIKMRYRKKKLEMELDNSVRIIAVREQELKDYILDLADKNRTINKMQEQIRQYSEPEQDSNGISQLLEQKILTDEDWSVFKDKFRKIYPMFFTRVKQSKVQLSEADIRIIMLLCLNLNGKEMASTLGISDQSARVGKLRLKKKLLADGITGIEEFMAQMVS